MAQLAIMGAVLAVQVGLQLLFQKKPKTPSQPELQPTSSIFGTPIKLTYGSMIQGGTVIWQSRRRKKKKDVGKGGGGATIVSYHQDFLISFGEAGRDIIAIFGDGKQQPIYDSRAKKNKRKYPNSPIRIYPGGDDQLPDSLVEKDRGVGNCSANRRINSVMFENFPLDDWGGRIPNVRALVVQAATQSTNIDPWITDFPGVSESKLMPGSLIPDRRPDHPYIYAAGYQNGWLYKIDTSDCSVANQQESAYGALNALLDSDSDGSLYWPAPAPGTMAWSLTTIGKFSADTLQPQAVATNTNGTPVLEYAGWCRVDQYSVSKFLLFVTSGEERENNSTVCFVDRVSMALRYRLSSSYVATASGAAWGTHVLRDADFDDQGVAWAIYSGAGSTLLLKFRADGTMTVIGQFAANCPNATSVFWVQEDNTLIMGNGQRLVKINCTTLEIVAILPLAWAANGNSFHAGITDHAFWVSLTTFDGTIVVPSGATAYFPRFLKIDVRTLTIVSDIMFTAAVAQYPLSNRPNFSPACAIFNPPTQSLIADDLGGQNIGCFQLNTATDCIPLRDVVKDLSLRTGRLDVENEVDVNNLVQNGDAVCGYVREQRQATRQDLELLGQAYAFYGVESDWKVRFHHFGGTPSLEIPEDDMAAFEVGQSRPDSSLSEELISDYERPKRVDLTYFDEDMNYQQNTQHWDITARNLQSSDKQTFTIPLVFRRDIAKDVARRLLYQIRNESVPYTFTLQPKYLFYDAGDDTTLAMNSGARLPVKFTKIALGANYLLQCEAVSINAPLYVPVLGKGGPGGGTVPIEIGHSPPTTLVLMDTTSLRDTDASLVTMGPYVAGAPSTGDTRNWTGAVLVKSLDGGSSWNEVNVITTPTIMGFAMTPLGEPRAWTVWDEDHTVQVKLTYEEEGLVSLTDEQVLAFNNVALLGDELIQFRTATPVGPAADLVWELSGLLRGRKGTEWAIADHQAGESFVLLNATTMDRLNDSISELNFPRIYRAVTAGRSLEESTPVSFTNTGRALKPYAPAFLQATQDSEGNITVTALRRSRLTNSWNPWSGPPLGEALEAYEMDVLNRGGVIRTMTNTALSFTYAETMRVADCGPGSVGALTFLVYQMSASANRGFAAEVTL